MSAVPATKLWFSVYVNRLAVCQKGSGWVPKALLNVQRIADVEEYFLRFNVLLMNYFVVITVMIHLAWAIKIWVNCYTKDLRSGRGHLGLIVIAELSRSKTRGAEHHGYENEVIYPSEKIW